MTVLSSIFWESAVLPSVVAAQIYSYPQCTSIPFSTFSQHSSLIFLMTAILTGVRLYLFLKNLFILIRGKLLYNIALVLPYINMNPPQVYTCSPSWTLLPPPFPYHPSGSSQCTSPKHPVRSDQIRSVAQSCPTLCDPMNLSTPGLPVHHQLPEFTQTHVHRVSDAIQPSHSLSSPSPFAFSFSWQQGLFRWVSSSHQVAKLLELQHQSF